MGRIIKDAPADLPTTNALHYLPDDILGGAPHMIRHGNRDLFVMDNPPADDDWIKVEYTFRAGDLVRKKPDADGVVKYVRIMEFLGAKLTKDPYKGTNNEAPKQETDPSFLDDNGQVPDEEPEEIEPDPEESDEDGDLEEIRPAFSHNGVDD